MSVEASLLDKLLKAPAEDAWNLVFEELWNALSIPIEGNASSELVRRDKSIEALELVLSSSAWELWQDFESLAPKTSTALLEFWAHASGPRAVLILDALSLRETPWILHGAKARGYMIKQARATGSALPSDTTSFAKLLGIPQRSSLSAGSVASLRLDGATTALFEQPWRECTDMLPNSPNLFIWHEWPDVLLHHYSAPGKGLAQLAPDIETALKGDDFWDFVDRLATGRPLVITSDHGYAASGQFGDVNDPAQKNT